MDPAGDAFPPGLPESQPLLLGDAPGDEGEHPRLLGLEVLGQTGVQLLVQTGELLAARARGGAGPLRSQDGDPLQQRVDLLVLGLHQPDHRRQALGR
jgi:hypothetical protein